MNIQDMVKNLESRIAYNREQKEYYGKKAIDEYESRDAWRQMEEWYEGRVSAYVHTLEMIKDSTVGLEFES